MKKLLLASLLFSASNFCTALDLSDLMGISTNTGVAHSKKYNGINTELGAIVVFGGGSMSYKNLGDKDVFGASLAIALSPVIQLHLGASNQGAFQKIKSEFCPFTSDFFSYPSHYASASSLERLNFYISYENYNKNKDLNNIGIGFGWLYN